MAEEAVDALCGIAAGGARDLLLRLLADAREYPPGKANAPPIRMGHIVMWRLQRLAKSGAIALDAEFWRSRLGW